MFSFVHRQQTRVEINESPRASPFPLHFAGNTVLYQYFTNSFIASLNPNTLSHGWNKYGRNDCKLPPQTVFS